MPTAAYNINYRQGSHYSQRFTFYAPVTTGSASLVPVDFTGFTARMQVRELVESTDYMIELTTENGMIEVDDEGHIDLEISVEDGAGIDVDGLYDLYVISADDKPERVLQGIFRFDAAVTRDD
jgi:hypothetical protein